MSGSGILKSIIDQIVGHQIAEEIWGAPIPRKPLILPTKETKMEQYLIDDYDVFEDTDNLGCIDDIESYFKDCGRDFLECGQGFYTDEADLIVKIGDMFYNVHITAEVWGDKQDRGDRLYYVNKITDVTYKEIDKPTPMPKQLINLGLAINHNQFSALKAWLDDHHIAYSNFT